MKELYNRALYACKKLQQAKTIARSFVEIDVIDNAPYKTVEGLPVGIAGWKPYDNSIGWGGQTDSHAWFRIRYNAKVAQNGELRLLWKDTTDGDGAVNPQFLVYDKEGKIIAGLDMWHTELPLEDSEGEVFIYAYTGMKPAPRLTLTTELICVDLEIEQLFYDLSFLISVADLYLDDSYDQNEIINVLNEAVDCIDFRYIYTDEFYCGVKAASKILRDKYLSSCESQRSGALAHCIGHTHIDIAWLWTAKQTREKAQRSFSTALNLMERYPEYIFMSSQPYLYECIKQDAPELFQRIKERVEEGRWVPDGGLWLEADCNITGGESLIRQIYYGKKFFKDEFGVDSQTVWLPDTFGYPATIPQIFVKSGMKAFVSSKISWNDTNIFPYDLFQWQGIDGSKILSYNLTAQDTFKDGEIRNITTYNAFAGPNQINGAWNRFRQKALTRNILFPYGFGDGGGGPTAEQQENIRRMAMFTGNTPKAKDSSLNNFFSKLNEDIKDKKLPVWRGDYYLEFHRGTYTSVGRIKRKNRKFEYRLQNAELIGAIGSCVLGKEYDYDKMESLWKMMLQNQFHDILPGSSIREVYEESDKVYQALNLNLQKIEENGIYSILSSIKTNGGYLVYNPNSHEVSACVDKGEKFYYVKNIPPKGWRVIANSDLQLNNSVTVKDKLIENEYVRVCFSDDYTISSILDKRTGNEILSPNHSGANLLQVFDESLEYEFDAWEIKNFYERICDEIRHVENVSVCDMGDRKGLTIIRKFRNSVIEQIVSLETGSSIIRFDCKVDWQEESSLLKVKFPVTINTDYAECDIQFGTARRPITRNNSLDEAKYEVCAHKFADLSQGDFGVALINDCKYGYDFTDGNLRLSLLKTSNCPQEKSDIGEHYFSYAFYPHIGSYEVSDVKEQSYLFNNPLKGYEVNKQDGILPDVFSFAKTQSDNVIIETVKPCEGGFILRAYETKNKNTNTTIQLGFKPKKAEICDLMEHTLLSAKINGTEVEVCFKPYEIITLRVTF